MYAYCNNSPIDLSDSGGGRPVWEGKHGEYTDTGMGANNSSGTGNAKPYIPLPKSYDPRLANCYAYALYYPFNLQPGDWSGQRPNDYSDVRSVYNSVKADLISRGYSVREIYRPNAPISSNERRIALRVGTSPYNEPIPPFAYRPKYDYHFMVQVNDGCWAEKHGYGGPSILHDYGMTPNNISWDLGDNHGYYDSPIIYFAIRKG